MEYSKLQIGCMLIVLYVSFIYIRGRHAYQIRQKDWLFELLLGVGIASIAFDGITAKRCYRKALPLPTCFQIIEEGSGRDFDPVIAAVFLSLKDQIAKVCEDQSAKSDVSAEGQQPFKNSSMAREK